MSILSFSTLFLRLCKFLKSGVFMERADSKSIEKRERIRRLFKFLKNMLLAKKEDTKQERGSSHSLSKFLRDLLHDGGTGSGLTGRRESSRISFYSRTALTGRVNPEFTGASRNHQSLTGRKSVSLTKGGSYELTGRKRSSRSLTGRKSVSLTKGGSYELTGRKKSSRSLTGRKSVSLTKKGSSRQGKKRKSSRREVSLY